MRRHIELTLNPDQGPLANPIAQSNHTASSIQGTCSTLHSNFHHNMLPLHSAQTRLWRARARNHQCCVSTSLFQSLAVIFRPNLFIADLGQEHPTRAIPLSLHHTLG